MLKIFNKYQTASPLILIYQLSLAIAILWTFISVVLSIFNIFSLISFEILKNIWISVFMPSTDLMIGSIIFPVSLQTQYTPQLQLYLSVSKLPILILLFYSCFQLKKVFKSFEVKNEAFTKANSNSFRNIGIAIIYAIVFQFAIDFGCGAFLSLIINTAGESCSELTGVVINIPMIFTGVLVASICFGIANMFAKGVELKEDNDSIV
jgi:hypothetical protein